MVSSTQQTTRIRRRKQATNGKTNKAERRLSPTPAFPIHLEAPAAPAKAEAAKPAAAAKAEAPKKEAAAKKEAAPAKAEPAKKEAAKPAKK